MRNMKRAAELIKCAVILHNLCILFSDNGDDPLDDADLDIDDDELDIDNRGTRGQTTAVAAALPMSAKNNTSDTSKLKLFQYHQKRTVHDEIRHIFWKGQIKMSFVTQCRCSLHVFCKKCTSTLLGKEKETAGHNYASLIGNHGLILTISAKTFHRLQFTVFPLNIQSNLIIFKVS